MDRREAVVACGMLAGWLAGAGDVSAETSGTTGPQQAPLFRQDLPSLSLDGWEVTARHVQLVGAGWLVKTTSGKVARGANREKFEREFMLRASAEERTHG